MYFKVNPTGCSEYKGLVEIRFDLYLDPEDTGYSEHYVEVPVIPKEGYTGELGDFGIPKDIEDYNKWKDSLSKEWVNNPFCCHFVQVEPTITDDEIVTLGEKVLQMAYKNWQDNTLHKNKNESVTFSTDLTKKTASEVRVESIKTTDFEAIKVSKKGV